LHVFIISLVNQSHAVMFVVSYFVDSLECCSGGATNFKVGGNDLAQSTGKNFF